MKFITSFHIPTERSAGRPPSGCSKSGTRRPGTPVGKALDGRSPAFAVLVVGLLVLTGVLGVLGVVSHPTVAVRSAPSPPVAVSPSVPAFPTPIQHVFVIFLENQELSAVQSGGPFEMSLAQKYAFESNYYSPCHPSAPNYLAVSSGATWQCGSDGVSTYTSENIGDLAQTAGLSWSGFFESMPSACDPNDAYPYIAHHNPYVYYADIVNNAAICNAHDVSFQSWYNDVSAGTIPNFAFFAPNMADDGHDTGVGYADHWLSQWLSPYLNASWFSSSVWFVTWDEGTTNVGYNGFSGGHLFFAAVSPYSVGGLVDSNDSTHYNLLSTEEWLLGIPVGAAGHNDGSSAYPPLKSLFNFKSKTTQYSVQGTVTAAGTGAPIPGATISLSSGNTTTTSTSGNYAVSVPNGTYTVTVHAGGWIGQSATVTVGGASVTQNFVLSVFRWPVAGSVTNASNGQPLSGATAAISGGLSSVTNATGRFAFLEENGSYTLSISATGYLSAARTITVAGASLTENFALAPKLPGRYAVTGVVTNASSGTAIAGATVTPSSGSAAVTNSSGGYLLSLPNGSYTLTASASGYRSSSTTVTVSGAPMVRSIALTPLPVTVYTVSGIVRSASTSATIAGATVTVMSGPTATSSASGGYAISLRNGSWELVVSAPGYSRAYANVTIVGAPATQNFALTPVAAPEYPISGTVRYALNYSLAAGVTVSLVGGGSTTSDAAGHYQLLAPNGTWNLTAWKTGYTVLHAAVAVAGGPTTHDFSLIRFTWALTGQVVIAAAGTPIANATVAVTAGPTVTVPSTRTSAAGGYALLLPNGTYTVTASATGYTNLSRAITVVGVPLVENYSLVPVVTTFPISGVVRYAVNGSAVVGATVTAVAGGSTLTDGSGTYRLVATNGTWVVTAWASGYAAARATVTVSGAPAYENYSLASYAWTLSGRVTDAQRGSAISNANVSVKLATAPGLSTLSNSSGGYSLPLPNGTYTITVAASGFRRAAALVTIAGAPATQDFHLLGKPRLFAVRGVVLYGPAGIAASGVTLTLNRTVANATGANGSFTLWAENGSYLLTVGSAGWQTQQIPLNISGTDLFENVSLAAYLFGVRGWVTFVNGTPAPDVHLAVTPGAVSTTTDIGGAFLLRLANGTYSVGLSAATIVPENGRIVVNGTAPSEHFTVTPTFSSGGPPGGSGSSGGFWIPAWWPWELLAFVGAGGVLAAVALWPRTDRYRR